MLLCFDLTNKETFNRIKLWLDEINDINPNLPIILLGNKYDLIDKRKITEEEVEVFAEKCSLPY